MNKKIFFNTKLTNNQIGIFYLGQEGFIIKFQDKFIMIDGYLSDYVDKNCSSENVKWVRRYAPPINPEELDFLDFVFCTHEHFDHADPYTLSAVAKVNKKVKFIVPEHMKDVLLSYGVSHDNIIPAEADKTIDLDCFKATPIPAAHEDLHKDKNGNYMELGYILNFENTTIYHAGDCCIYDGLEERIKNTDILMLPVNGRSFYKLNHDDIVGNMTSEEAVILSKHISPKLLIPMHFDLYDVNCINPAQFVDTLYTLTPYQSYHIFVPGERFIFEK